MTLSGFDAVVILDAASRHARLTVAQAQTLLAANDVQTSLGCYSPSPSVAQAQRDLLDLVQTINGLSLDAWTTNDLLNGVRAAEWQLTTGQGRFACGTLSRLGGTITADARGRHPRLTPTQAATLVAAVDHVSTELGCPSVRPHR
jgi:hypothetical protein